MSNPFDMNNLGGMMAGLQSSMQAMQEQAGNLQVEGSAGGGLVRVIATGNQDIVSVSISEDAMDDREMLEDLVRAATSDALRKAKEAMAAQLQQLTGGLGLPPGLF